MDGWMDGWDDSSRPARLVLRQAEIETDEEQEARTPLSEVREDDELWGEVTKVSNYGAFVDVGVEVQGFLHIIYYPKRGPVRGHSSHLIPSSLIPACPWTR